MEVEDSNVPVVEDTGNVPLVEDTGNVPLVEDTVAAEEIYVPY